MKIEIGGGPNPREGWENLDPRYGRTDNHNRHWRRKLQEGIPVGPGSVDAIRASHVLEHIRLEDRIWCMNEVYRALKPGAPFEIIVPQFPHEFAIADPTHLSFWVGRSFVYFDGSEWDVSEYGIQRWDRSTAEQCQAYDGREGWFMATGEEIRVLFSKPTKEKQ